MNKTIGVAGVLFACWIVGGPALAEEIVMPAGTELRVVLETTLNTKESNAGDPFTSRMVIPVFVNEREALPVGCLVEGTLASMKAPGRVKGKAQMQLRPEKLTFPDGRTISLTASVTGAQTGEEIDVDPEEGTITGPGKDGIDARQVGTGAAAATGIGAAMGGGKGALIGAGAVGAVALFHRIFKRGKDAVLPAGSEIVLELTRPVSFNTLEEVPPGERQTLPSEKRQALPAEVVFVE